ncbi:MAG: hypothetical protein DI536_09445 [Archangium gephyra]|uniref:FHA domain-containing protein n=1 Tax=Archangium gephyra TaxID=48 RepID=A0A2W5VWH4_9BACT|nr:MAG: hypothetical protein DI536_09445 [Archangium gephyra]
MPTSVVLRLPDDTLVTASPGAIIGRAFSAEVSIQDGRVSEAHALLSLRDGALVLLALRGRLRVDGADVPRVTLREGQTLELARSVSLRVEAVRLPSRVLAVEGEGVPTQVLSGVVSVCVAPKLHLVSGVVPDAAALIFSDGLAWFLREGSEAPRRVRADEAHEVAGHALRFVERTLGQAGVPETAPGAPASVLKLSCHDDVAHVWPAAATEPVMVSGQAAQLLRVLLDAGAPLRWEALATKLWPRDEVDEVVRHRLDVLLGKLRRRLEAGGVRRDLVTAHRNGSIELVLYPGDQAHARGARAG